jgi:hypothetical protein
MPGFGVRGHVRLSRKVADQIIMALGLGSGQDISPPAYSPTCSLWSRHQARTESPARPRTPARTRRQICRPTRPHQICRHVTVPHGRYYTNALQVCSHKLTGRRSVQEELKRPKSSRFQAKVEPELLSTDPIPFNMIEHAARYRRWSGDNCEYQHIHTVFSGHFMDYWR